MRPAHDASATTVWDMAIDRLIPYLADMGFTHVELLPITEHPFGGSWGYQPLSLFAPSARYGPPEGFARFVDALHAAGIGIILDWVPAHFPTDAHGLARFDGTALYEHLDPREGFHQDWNTYIYNFGRREVQGFLIASALHWLEHFHVDGLRVDAVASMLYRDYSRKPANGCPNVHGGRENLEAVGFLRHLNAVVAERCPGAMMIAEESTAWPGVTQPVSEHGLGFAYKWNMGWMHDTLQYIERDPIHRAYHHDEITFGLLYAFSEKFILPLSHDEVVYGKHSLIGKMPGDRWQKFANLRAYFGFMWAHPGKKLLFMGGEIAQWGEWNHDAEIDWSPARRAGSRRHPAARARSQPALSRRARAARARCRRGRLPLGDRRRSRQLRVRIPALGWRRREARARRLQHDAGAAASLSHRRAARRDCGARSPTPTRASTAAAMSGTMGRSTPLSILRTGSRNRSSSRSRRSPR